MNLFTKLTSSTATSVAALAFCFGTAQLQAQFTAGNVVVLQIGDGSAALNSASQPLILQEYTPTGVTGYSMAIPTSTATGNALTASGSATSEGLISRSGDGRLIVIPGYYANAGTASIASTSSSLVPRGIGIVDGSGSYSLAVTSNTFYSGNNIRGAASDGNGNFWATGNGSSTTGGTTYLGTTSTPTIIQNATTNTRASAVYNNQLYYSTSSGTRGIFSLNSALPVTPAATVNIINTGSTSSPYQFAFNPTGTVCYIADDNNVAGGGGIQKWVNTSGTWSLAYTFTLTGAAGPRGVAVDFSGTNPMIYATTGETATNTPDKLVSIMDGGSLVASTTTTLAVSPTNTVFRGVVLAPLSCQTPTISSINAGSAICAGQTLSLNAAAAGTAPFTYTWTGAGSINSANNSSTSVGNPTAGNYTITVGNACGTATAAVTATVNALPAITTNSATICAGDPAILNAGGASTYTWSTTENTQTISVNPGSTTVYTVMGTDANGCVGSNTANVMVNSLPMVTATSATNCAGAPASLTAGGANTYTWSTTATGGTIVVMPTNSTNYTVTGTDGNGCVNSATASVTTSTLPVISVNTPTTCAGSPATLIASGANTYTWSTTATTFSITDNPMITASYTVSGTDNNGCIGMTTTSIVVNALPAVNSTSATICSGGTATLTASGANTYTWSTAATTSTIAASPSAPTNYTVMGTDANGCVNTAIGSVNVTSAPSITVNSATICAGSSATLTASGVSTYTWSNGDNSASTIVSPSSTAVYTVSGQASGCGAVTASNTAVVNVNSLPSVSLSPVGPLCVNAGTVALSGAPAGGSFMGTGITGSSFDPATAGVGTFSVSYMYTDANSCSNTAITSVTVNALPSVSITPLTGPFCSNSPSVALAGSPAGGSFSGTGVTGNGFSPATAGVGTFTISYLYTDANSCSNSNTTTVTVSSCTGIKNIQKASSFSVYPNPAKEVLNVQFEGNGPVVIEVYDALGNQVFTAETSEDHALINISGLNRGLYFVRLKGAGIQATSRFIKD